MAQPDISLVISEALSLLANEKISDACASFNASTPEKEIACEYVSAYAQFICDVADTDREKGRQRADYEIRELVGHINAMLKQKQEDIFMKMVLMCPKHYLYYLRKQP